MVKVFVLAMKVNWVTTTTTLSPIEIHLYEQKTMKDSLKCLLLEGKKVILVRNYMSK